MNFVEVKKTQKDAIRFIYQSYSETFSENERRDEEGFIHLFEQKNVSVFL